MWPWEHAGVGYVLYSLSLRATGRQPPGETDSIALLVGTQLPDLVDKPASWGLGLFPTGSSLAHSALLGVPLGATVLVWASGTGRFRATVAAVVGYWSHLAADVLNPLRNGNGPAFDRVLWPVVRQEPYETDLGLNRGFVYFWEFLGEVQTTEVTGVSLLYLLAPILAVGLWIRDGWPGLALLGRLVGSLGKR